MVRDMFADMINLNWANMSFYQLAYDQMPPILRTNHVSTSIQRCQRL